MAENSPHTTNLTKEDEKIDLIGDLIMKIEAVLSPKPINVWHLPGALERILSSTLQIFIHGCKTDSENNSQLWNFIFGLRVIRPDLWPTYELKSNGGNLSNSELVSQWLELSLQSHLLFSQLKTLLDDRKRLHTYYHPWAFLRTRQYTDALLTVLQALEHNSQDKLATVNPSLMVKFYSKKKKKDEGTEIPFSFTGGSEKVGKQIPNSNGVDFSDTVNGRKDLNPCKKEENNASMTIWEDEDDLSPLSSNLSPSLLKIDYNNSFLSDGERTDTKNRESVSPNPSNPETGDATQKMKFDKDVHLSPRRRRMSLHDDRFFSKSANDSSVLAQRAKMSFISTSAGNLKEASASVLIDQNNVVQPSQFLIEYLASKAKYLSTHNLILNEILDDTEVESISSAAQSFARGETETNLEWDELFRLESPIQNACSPSSVSDTPSSQQRVPLKKVKKCVSPIAVAQQSQEVSKAKPSHFRSHSDGVKRIVAESPRTRATSVSFSEKSPLPNPTAQIPIGSVGSRGSVRKTFMEDGGQSITPVADGFFPKPQPGQTLINFLTSDQFTKATAQLDRENAHFSIAEAVLAAIEQMNYETGRKGERRVRRQIPDESEEDVSSYQKFPSNRRKLRDRSSVPFFTENSDEEPVTTDHSVFDSPEPQSSDDDSTTMSSELCNEIPEGDSDGHNSCSADPSSAENIAIAILMHYNSRLLPKASELQWLVSEQDAPQKLLPMPTSVPVSPDDAEGETFQPLLRGTSDWAPPRPQLILTLHKNTKRKARLIDQKWRCAGCGLAVSEKLSSHFRLCHYLGRFFCTSCHTNQKAVVPAKVLHKWDFKKYAVCNFSYELLIRMSADPLFHVGTLNPRLYKQSRDLHQTLIYRLQLFHAWAYIVTCSKGTRAKSLLENVPVHWYTDPHVYSLDDLLAVKKGVIIHQIKHLTTTCINHISSCPICLGQGFICEICREGNPIFPFQLDAVTQCTKCRECFHFLCFSPNGSCPRCERRDKRDGRKECAANSPS